MNTEDTLPKLFKRNYERFGNRAVAMREKDFGIWKSYTWEDYYRNVKYLSLCLVKLGLVYGEKVAILGETKPEAYWTEMAAQAVRGTVLGIFTDCGPDEVKYFIEITDTKFMVVQDQEQVDKVLAVKDDIPQVTKVIYWDPKGLWNYKDPLLMSIEEALEIGREYERDHPGEFEKTIESGRPEDIAVICVTSGTTGKPKAAMLSQGGMVEAAAAFHSVDHFSASDNYLSFIPIAWITEQLFGIACSTHAAYPVNFPESVETVQTNIRELGASILFFGPRQWESINRMVQVKILDSTWLKQKFYNLLLPVGNKMVDLRLANKNPGLRLKLLHGLAYWFLFRRLKDNLGLSKVRVSYTSGSSISPEIIRFFHAIGVNIKQIYGSSEMGLVTAHRDGDIRPETSGKPVPGAEVSLSKEGEILVKNKAMFVGYYKNQVATDEKIKNGWYYSGDFGYIDNHSHLIVIDRMGDLRALKGGKKFSPQYLEVRLRFSPYIKEVLIVGGEERDFVSAIVNIDLDNVGRWAESRKIVYTTFADLSQKDEVINLIREEIVKVNETVPKDNRIKRFLNIHKELDADEAELTRTRKLRRTFLEERYKQLIEALYSEGNELEVETPIVYRDGRKGVMKRSIKISSL